MDTIDFVKRLEAAGGPAYPSKVLTGDGGTLHCHGMTLRQHYAGLAMQGLLAHYGFEDPNITSQARMIADGMLEELAP